MNTRAMIWLEPADVWSFRDGRPFEAGEAFEARSLFPPSPWSTLGAIRTAALRHHCPDVERYAGRGRGGTCPACGTGPCHAVAHVGHAGGAAPFAVGPPLPARRTATGIEVLFPWPADVAYRDARAGTLGLLRPLDLPAGVVTASEFRPVGWTAFEEPAPVTTSWTTVAGLEAWMRGEADGVERVAHETVAVSESRVGIGMNSTRNVTN